MSFLIHTQESVRDTDTAPPSSPGHRASV